MGKSLLYKPEIRKEGDFLLLRNSELVLSFVGTSLKTQKCRKDGVRKLSFFLGGGFMYLGQRYNCNFRPAP